MTGKWWLEPHPDLMEKSMSEPKKYFTAVFECTEAYAASSFPLYTETPWGIPISVCVGDKMHEADIYEDALTEIAEDGCSRCAEIAQKAIDTGSAYINEQIIKKSLKPMSPPSETEQLDLGEQG